MNIDIENLVRKNIRALKPYSSARSEFTGKASILLDANENAFGSPLSENYNRYSDPEQKKLKKRIAAVNGVEIENISIGNGSDRLIDNLIRIFCEPGKDSIITCPPVFSMYEVAGHLNDVTVERVLLNDHFQLQTDKILEAATTQTKIIFLCSPNNPTGNSMQPGDLQKIIDNFKGIVVVDEAYIHFARQKSILSLIHANNNLVVLQTLSKAWGLAGLRVGMAFADAAITSWMARVKMPYNVNSASQKLVLEALDKDRQMAVWRDTLVEEREKMETELKQLGFVKIIYPSDANFILIRFKDSLKIYDYLASNGIIVRNQGSQPGLHNCLRFTVGTPKENKQLLAALKNFTN